MKQLSQTSALLLLLALLSGCSTLSYYHQAVAGHLSLMVRSEPIKTVLATPDLDPDLEHKLTLADSARQFAENTLALPVGSAFTRFVELDSPWVVVNLVAVPEFSLTPHQWCYPVVGCQAYRGYFQLDPARHERQQFQNQGYDTFIGAVTAYSTLGWFDDLLHTGFTRLDDERMVALMFHELAHQVVYINHDSAFNESFATAVELEGLRRWLEQTGKPEGFRRALQRLEHRNQTLLLVQDISRQLTKLYQQKDALPVEPLRARKQALLDVLAWRYQQLAKNFPEPGPFGTPPVNLNNANLALFRQYNQHVPAFRQLLRDHQGDFASFYRAVIQLSQAPEADRHSRLKSLSERFVEHL